MTAASNVTVATSWSGPSGQLRNSSGISLSNAYEVSEGVFQSNVTIFNYIPSVNNGEYACNATVVPTSPYVIGTGAVNRRNISISGLFCYSEVVYRYIACKEMQEFLQ